MHNSFEEILLNLAQYKNDYLIIPAAFKSEELKMSWGELHYQYLERLKLIDSFQNPLDELVIVENLNNKTGIGYTHAATSNLLLTKTNLTHIDCVKANLKRIRNI